MPGHTAAARSRLSSMMMIHSSLLIFMRCSLRWISPKVMILYRKRSVFSVLWVFSQNLRAFSLKRLHSYARARGSFFRFSVTSELQRCVAVVASTLRVCAFSPVLRHLLVGSWLPNLLLPDFLLVRSMLCSNSEVVKTDVEISSLFPHWKTQGFQGFM